MRFATIFLLVSLQVMSSISLYRSAKFVSEKWAFRDFLISFVTLFILAGIAVSR